MKTRKLTPAMVLALALAACNGSTGPQGPAGLDTGTISGTVKSSTGAPVSGASVTTTPATTTVQTDSSGAFTLSAIPIGSYQITATLAGYATAQQSGVGVAAGATTQVSLTLSPATNAAGSVTGTVYSRHGAGQSVALAGATVCLEGPTNLPCAKSQSDGSFALPNVPPGSAFLSATAPGLLATETREAVFVSAGTATSGVAMTLSGSPGSGATYVGFPTCVKCHSVFDGGLVSAWQSSAHGMTVGLTLNHVDTNGWPSATGATCAAPNTLDSGLMAPDPADLQSREVILERRPANCPGPGQPQFAMAFKGGTTVMPVDGTQGGVAGDVGNCGTGGILPAANPCTANYLGGNPPTQHGWWQQEYLVKIGPGFKPSWVTWDTSGTSEDLMALPLAWNQRGVLGGPPGWIPAPDYWTSSSATQPQAGTFSRVCTGCHDTGASLTADANGFVTQYGHFGATAPFQIPQNIACERCHGPGSTHVAQGGANGNFSGTIINPAYETAQARDEMCGQCHTNLVASTQPAGTFDFAWNNQATTGGGNFIPGVHNLSDFATFPAYGTIGTAAPLIYWPGGVFVALDHMSYVDVQVSAHNTNPYWRVTCSDCHESHSLAGAPYQMQRTDTNGDKYVFQTNDAALRNDVLCLSCHATQGDFASVQLADAARYHISTGNGAAVQKNGTPWSVSAADQSTSAQVVADAVNAHMLSRAGMPAFFDPTASTQPQPVGRCSSCHMAKTASTATYFTAMVGSKTANIAGDVTSHVFKVAWPQDSLTSLSGLPAYAGTTPMPNACGACHTQYLVAN